MNRGREQNGAQRKWWEAERVAPREAETDRCAHEENAFPANESRLYTNITVVIITYHHYYARRCVRCRGVRVAGAPHAQRRSRAAAGMQIENARELDKLTFKTNWIQCLDLHGEFCRAELAFMAVSCLGSAVCAQMNRSRALKMIDNAFLHNTSSQFDNRTATRRETPLNLPVFPARRSAVVARANHLDDRPRRRKEPIESFGVTITRRRRGEPALSGTQKSSSSILFLMNS